MKFQLLLSLIFSLAIKAAAAGPVVHTQNGDVLGVLDGSVESFKALPYAAPPVGNLRWRPPQDPANWPGIRDASTFSSPCPQKSDQSIVGNEDCLYLNVFRPQGAQGLPVIVFIHGGHNATGSAGDPGYDGTQLALDGNVVVTINYRLAALGFIAHRKLSDESGYHGSGNYGYMDQIRALKWVHRNIASFGGDPNNVTLLGQSAGGGGVSVLMATPLTEGLFHRAVIHSGQFREESLADAEKHGASLSQTLNCQNAPDELQCMRNASATDIVVAMPGGHFGGCGGVLPSVTGPCLFLPVVDGRVVPEFTLEIFRKGKHHHMPLLIGNVAEETSWIYEKDSANIHTEQDYMNQVGTDYGANANDLLKVYPASDYPSPRQAFNAISADHWFVCPAQKLVKAVSASQLEFVGRFFYTQVPSGPTTLDSPAYYGASHGDDLLYLFGTFGSVNQQPSMLDELTLEDNFQKTWTDFARSGKPGKFWNRYDAAKDDFEQFHTPLSSDRGLHTKQCRYWDSFVPAAQGPEAAAQSVANPPVVNERALRSPPSPGGKD